ncbi:hypothetical protein ACR30L_13695 [Psychromonas sp. PT13]|uniref:hypothetical protein n=1 Tax=Psychromonas sp. PT13 TaxID=3439547 RepID=UPI003EBF9981
MNQSNLKGIFSSTTLSLLLVTSYAHAHSGHLNEKAVSVCENKVRSDTCQYEGGHHDLYRKLPIYVDNIDVREKSTHPTN